MPKVHDRGLGWLDARQKVLKQLGFATYGDYLASPLWKGIRIRVLARARYACQICSKPGRYHRAVEIHHQSYDLDTMQGTTLDYLVALCHRCHRRLEFKGKGKRSHKEVVGLCRARLTGSMGKGRKVRPKSKGKPSRSKG